MTFKFFKPPRLQESLHAEFNSNLTPWDVMKTISVMAKFASQHCLPLSHVCLEKIKREAQKIIFKIKMRLWVILSWFLKAMSAAVVAVQVAFREEKNTASKGKKGKENSAWSRKKISAPCITQLWKAARGFSVFRLSNAPRPRVGIGASVCFGVCAGRMRGWRTFCHGNR